MMRFSRKLTIVICLVALAWPGVLASQPSEPPPEENETTSNDGSDVEQPGSDSGSAEAESGESEPGESEPGESESEQTTQSAETTEPEGSEEPASQPTAPDTPEGPETQPTAPTATAPTESQEGQADTGGNGESAPGKDDYGPPLPDGMSLDDVLTIAAQPAPGDFPRTIPDDRFYVFLLGEQLEYRAEDVDGSGELGLEWQAWAGGDFNKVWLKTDAEAALVGETEVEAETDLLYSRLITPFWNLQLGAQYAFGWAEDSYEDLWSAALALQGMSPGSLEVDASLYLSEAFDFTASLSLEYDLRITQRLVLQPHAELGFSAQESVERGLGVGLTEMKLDGRLRYEIRREFAPYLGVRYRLLTFGTADFARDSGESPGAFFVLAGLRFAL